MSRTRPRDPAVAATNRSPTSRNARLALSIPRRFLPSLAALSAFEATARTGSVTEAALELNLTQSAISRQISALEEQLEVQLFFRERQKIRLTLAGQTYVRVIREGLKRIGSASMNLRANPAGGTLNVAVPPAFSAKWLMPRLPDFFKRHPEVAINIHTRESAVAFHAESFDAAIRFGDADARGVQVLELSDHEVLPACSPAMRKKYSFKQPQDLRRAPLLHLTSWPDGWEQWLECYRVPAQPVHGMLVDQVLSLAAAAEAGIGLALLPPLLFAEEFRRGVLVPALPMSLKSSVRYQLAWPRDRDDYLPLHAFRAWLLQQLSTGKASG